MATAPQIHEIDLFAPKAGIDPGRDLEIALSTRCTDISNAGRICERYGSILRFVPEWGWVLWNGPEGRWRVDHAGLVRKIAHDLPLWIQDEAYEAAKAGEKDISEALWKHAKQSGMSPKIDAALKEAQPLLYKPASEFDLSPFAINCANVTVNPCVPEGFDVPEFREHTQADYLTKRISFDWNLAATCPRWLTFLEEILPDPEVRDWLHKAVGYSLTGITTEQCFFIAYGTGANGKSVFLNVLRHVFADYAMQADPATFLQQRDTGGARPDLARLAGVRFLSAIETTDGKRLDEALVKSVTGGEPIVARHLYREPFEFLPEFKLWLGTNHKPVIRDATHSIWRRIRLIPFTVTIPPERMDRSLEAKLKREAEGILAWCIEGARRYFQQGLEAPEIVKAAGEEYRTESDFLGQFISEHLAFEPLVSEYKIAVYESYKTWCENNGLGVMSNIKFSKALQERGLDFARDNNGKHLWLGIRVK